jgi:hypothetical protein
MGPPEPSFPSMVYFLLDTIVALTIKSETINHRGTRGDREGGDTMKKKATKKKAKKK